MAERGRQYLILADEDLISLVEAADAEAFATLYDRHSRAAFSLAYRMMGERQASEDRTQEKIEASAPRSQPSEAFAETLRNSQRDQVKEALNTLPPEQLKILELAYFSGYTHVELSDLLGLPLGTVKGRMRLGLKKIRDYFESRDAAVPR